MSDVENQIRAAQAGDVNACQWIDEQVRLGELPWSAQRRTGIGGSDVAAILGMNPWRRPIDVYLEKMGRAEPQVENAAMRWGKLLEPVIADDYARRHGVQLRELSLTMRDWMRPWHLATVDRVLGDPAEVIIEIKSRGDARRRDYGPDGTDAIPQADYCQVAWYMHALDVPAAVLVVLFNGRDIQEHPIKRDHQIEQDMIEQVDSWWQSHIVEDRAPEPDGSDSYSDYLARIADESEGYQTPSERDMSEVRALRELECLARTVSAARDKLRQRVGSRIGSASGWELAEGKLSFRQQRGRVNQGEVMEALRQLAGMSKLELAQLQERHRYQPTRPMRTPRAWSQDRLDDYLPTVAHALRQIAGD